MRDRQTENSIAVMDKYDFTILYLEDDPDSVELVSFTLGLDKIGVKAVSNAEEALESVMIEEFDLFMLDGLVDTGYSFELCRKLRKLCPSIPIAYYTALGFPQDIQNGLKAGADIYLVKPFVGDLAHTIRQAIANRRDQAMRFSPLCERPPQNTAARM